MLPFTIRQFFLFGSCGFALARVAHSPRTSSCSWNPLGPLKSESVGRRCTKPIDDSSLVWAPWSHRPSCAHPKNDGSSPYCVYTFNQMRTSGLSLLATPEIAADLVDYLGNLDNLDPTWLHLQAQNYHRRPQTEDSAYEVRDVAGKGKGAVATRLIRAGEVIIREVPAILNIPQLPEGMQPSDAGPMFDLAVHQLPDEQQRRIFEMARAGAGNLVHDILDINSYRTNVNGHFVSALCPEISRINHACRPNVFNRFSQETLTMESVAYVDIQPGEELTASYLPPNLLNEDRKEATQKWGFNCSCDICSSPDKAAESDRNKLQIQEVLNQLEDKSNRVPAKVDALIHELFSLIEAERLQAQTGAFASLITGVYLSMQDLEKAREYAALSLEQQTHYIGHDSEKTKEALEMVELLDGVSLEYE